MNDPQTEEQGIIKALEELTEELKALIAAFKEAAEAEASNEDEESRLIWIRYSGENNDRQD